MRRGNVIGRVGGYCLLCLGVETLITRLYFAVLDILLALGWIGSVNDVYAAQFPYLSMAVRILPALSLVLFFKLRSRDPIHELNLHPVTVGDAVLAVVTGVLSCFAVSYLLTVIPFPEGWQETYTEQSSQVVMQGHPIATALSTVVLAPFAEEIVYRGILYGHLRNGMPRVAAALLSAAVFGWAHGTAIWLVYTFLLGLLFVYLFEKTGSLLPCIISHITFNLIGQVGLLNALPPLAVFIVYALSVPLLLVVIMVFLKNRKRPC